MFDRAQQQWDDDGLPADPEMSPQIDLEPGETLVWTGRPASTGRLVRMSIPHALFGLVFIGFTVFWMIGVTLHGLGKPNPNRVVRPFEPHNIGIAVMAGLWLLPPGFFLLTWPLRRAWRLNRTHYALTDRRAIVIEPGLFGRTRVQNYRSESLTLMRREVQPDASGDLIFEERTTLGQFPEPIGFLAIANVQEIESLVRRTLAPGRRPGAGWPRGFHGNDERLAAPIGQDIIASRAYRLLPSGFAFFAVFGLLFLIGTLIALGWLIVFPLALIMGRVPVPDAAALMRGLGTGLIMAFLIMFPSLMLYTMPTAITIDEKERNVWFLNWFRSRSIPAADFISIRTGGWRDPNRVCVEIRHKRGKLRLNNQYRDFRDFLVRLKALNPSIEITGF